MYKSMYKIFNAIFRPFQCNIFTDFSVNSWWWGKTEKNPSFAFVVFQGPVVSGKMRQNDTLHFHRDSTAVFCKIQDFSSGLRFVVVGSSTFVKRNPCHDSKLIPLF